MDNKKLERFREKLLNERDKLYGGVEKALTDSKAEVNGGVPDISDEATRTYARQVLLNLGEKERDQLELVERALKKLDEGQYGVCDTCQGRIPEGRLQAIPFTRYCVNCQDETERGEKR